MNVSAFLSQCVGLADQYAGPLYDFLVEEMDPAEVCKEIGICHSTIKGRAKVGMQFGCGY